MSQETDKGWLDSLSEILNSPLPGTAGKDQPTEAQPPIPSDDEEDDSLLDRITDILSQPLPGTSQETQPAPEADAPAAPPQANPAEEALRQAEAGDESDPVSTTGAAGADWMQREYEVFNNHQEKARRAFAERQRQEQARFQHYQETQLASFTHTQERERRLFREHQQHRFQAWRVDLQQQFSAPGAGPGWGPRPGAVRPPPPPWWRGRR